MSAPSHYAKEAEQIKYSLLAAKAKESISKLLIDQALDEDDKQYLIKATEFLNSVSEGVKLVSSGHYSGHNSREIMQSLQIAIDPIKHLEKINEDKGIASYISELANSLDLAVSNPEKIKDSDTKSSVESAARFFSVMFDYLLVAVTENQKSGNILFQNQREYA